MKGFPSMNERMANQLNDCLKIGKVLSSMTEGYTVSIMKGEKKVGKL